MKKTAHGLKIDRRKRLDNVLKDNGLERKINKGSGKIKIKESKLRRAKKNNDTELINKLELELKELYSQIEE